MGGGTSKNNNANEPTGEAPVRAETQKEGELLQSSLKSKISGAVKQGNWADFYERKQDLGSGMSGVVFLVERKGDKSGETFACKSIAKRRMGSEEVEALRQEISLCASLDHPNIVKIVESFESDSDITMIMECCRGGELYDSLIDEGEYTQKRAAELFKMMVQAVNYCHQVGVVHRDLKLENFVFEDKPASNSVLKLIDFGLSVKHGGGGNIKKMKSVVGTAYYMAPEVLDTREDYDNKCDVWALGVILFMILTGSPPFNGRSEKQIMKKAAEGLADWDSWHHGPEFNNARDLIAKMLTPAKYRYSCEQVLQHKWLQNTNTHEGGAINRDVVNALNKFSKRGKLYRSSAQIIAVKLSPSELHELRAQFQLVDTDSSGTISLEEFKKAVTASSPNVDASELSSMFNSIDLDGTGLISYSEFLSATLSTTDALTKERLNTAFDTLDPDGSGSISTAELKGLLSAFTDDMEIEKILASVDVDKSNSISREEFLSLCMGHTQASVVQSALDEHLQHSDAPAGAVASEGGGGGSGGDASGSGGGDAGGSGDGGEAKK